MKENLLARLHFLLLSFLTFLLLPNVSVPAAQLDDFYDPLLEKNKFLYSFESSFYRMQEHGQHGSLSFGAFDSEPDFWSVSKALRYSPGYDLEFELGFAENFSDEYRRLTYDPAGTLAFNNQYEIDQFHEFLFNVRKRSGPFEWYLDTSANRQNASWHSAPDFSDFNFFTDIRSHYEMVKGGIRYISESESAGSLSSLSYVLRPLLKEKQVNIEAALGYRNGRLRRTNLFFGTPSTIRDYIQELRLHFIPQTTVRYGLTNRLEVESGFSYTTPFKYKYEFHNSASATRLVSATYELKNNFHIPLKFRYRPGNNLQISFASDIRHAKQKMDHWELASDSSISSFSPKKLDYLNTQPTLELSYLYDAGKRAAEDKFSNLSKPLLLEKQLLIELKFVRDVTTLDKNAANGAQNMIDPYNLFFYPVDSFVAGTEYSAFLAGNATSATTHIAPQNHYQLEALLTYGLADRWNMGIGVGYQSESTLHHFIFQEPTNPADAFFRFEPYYYFDVLSDWRLTENSLLSLKTHLVPWYKTFVRTDAHPKEFEIGTRYFDVSLALKIHF